MTRAPVRRALGRTPLSEPSREVAIGMLEAVTVENRIFPVTGVTHILIICTQY